jgi:hypothetical protein
MSDQLTQPKAWGNADTQSIIDVQTFEDGKPDLKSLKPNDAGDDWTPPKLVPLVKLPQPQITAGQKAKPKLVWHEDRVERDWDIIDKTQAEIAAERLTLYPSAESYQVRAWMIRGGLDPDLVPTIIAQVVPDGPQRKEALMRWDYAVRIPRDFPLTNVIGAAMNLTPEQIDAAWPEILTL